jgi:hypothetical protein
MDMNASALHWLGYSLVVIAAAVPLAGCGDESGLGPENRPTISALPPAGQAGAFATGASSGTADRVVDLGACDELRVPEGSKLAFHVYAKGVQIYQWDGQSWLFKGPSATLYADAAGTGTVGIHYGGPTWENLSGGLLVGALREPCDQDPANIPWLLLDVVRNEGPGVFQKVAFIQRVNTVGGRTPSGAGSFTGEVRNVPYTAEYFFFRTP